MSKSDHQRRRSPWKRDPEEMDAFARPPFPLPRTGAERSAYVPAGAPAGPEADATVKWFNAEKGFGFVELADGSGDVFLHASALTRYGLSSVNPGDTLRVRVGQGQKGRQVSDVTDHQAGTAPPPPARRSAGPRPSQDFGPATEMRGTVKWYNATKGFGFVTPESGGKDVFVHATVLTRSGLTQLAEGQAVVMEVAPGAKGPEAKSIRLP